MYTLQVNEGFQGDHRYFTGTAPIGEIDHIVVFPDDLEDLDEDHEMQRGLAKTRISPLVDYVLENRDHFFSAVTLMILPRDIDRPALEGDQDQDEFDYAFERAEKMGPGKQRQGLLHLSGTVQLFPADGQHRLAALRRAIAESPDLASEDLPFVVIPYIDANQVRQMFSDLNLNAKPVSKTIGLAYETRDPLALLGKAVAKRVRLFDDRVNYRTNSLPKSSPNVITLNTLVQGSKAIVDALAETQKTTSAEFLSDHGRAVTEVADVWEEIIESFEPHWAEVLENQPGAAGELRERYVFPHGLGWVALARAAATLIREYGDQWAAQFRTAVRALDWERTAEVWDGNAVIHDRTKETNRVNNTGPAITQMAELIAPKARAATISQ